VFESLTESAGGAPFHCLKLALEFDYAVCQEVQSWTQRGSTVGFEIVRVANRASDCPPEVLLGAYHGVNFLR
jgi:hypothetical protein